MDIRSTLNAERALVRHDRVVLGMGRCAAIVIVSVLLGLASAGCDSGKRTVALHGAGSTLPAPLYQRWFADYSATHPGIQIRYEAVGSGEGVRRFIDGSLDFGASDIGMTDDQIARVPSGVQMIPMTASALALAYNPAGLPNAICLSRAAYSGICLGRVVTWNDSAIGSFNPDLALPAMPITFVHRSDESGSTIVLHRHLCAISSEWREHFGGEPEPTWPVGVGAKGEDGVVERVKTTPGAIGYMSYSRAREEKLPMATLENNAGSLVAPSVRSGQAGLAGFHLPPNLLGWVDDPPGRTAYPIVTLTWMLCYKKYEDPDVAAAMRDLIHFGLSERGQQMADDFGFVRLSEPVVNASEIALDNVH